MNHVSLGRHLWNIEQTRFRSFFSANNEATCRYWDKKTTQSQKFNNKIFTVLFLLVDRSTQVCWCVKLWSFLPAIFTIWASSSGFTASIYIWEFIKLISCNLYRQTEKEKLTAIRALIHLFQSCLRYYVRSNTMREKRTRESYARKKHWPKLSFISK